MYTLFPNKAHSLKNRLHNKNNITEKCYKRKQCGVPSFRAGMIITQPLRLRYGLGVFTWAVLARLAELSLVTKIFHDRDR